VLVSRVLGSDHHEFAEQPLDASLPLLLFCILSGVHRGPGMPLRREGRRTPSRPSAFDASFERTAMRDNAFQVAARLYVVAPSAKSEVSPPLFALTPARTLLFRRFA
jgi:hypothetical protein